MPYDLNQVRVMMQKRIFQRARSQTFRLLSVLVVVLRAYSLHNCILKTNPLPRDLKKCKNKFHCLVYEMLLIRELTPSLNVQSDSTRAKLFARHSIIIRFSGKPGVRSVENPDCGKRGVWKMRSVESEECRKCGVWKVWNVENAECGK